MELDSYQGRVSSWMAQCFPPAVIEDKTERAFRFLEEALELAQAQDVDWTEAVQLVSYVFNRPKGEPHQEVGGVMVTLAALCSAAEMDLEKCAEIELARVWDRMPEIQRKQAAKPSAIRSPLPRNPI